MKCASPVQMHGFPCNVSMFSTLFMDKRFTAAVLLVWLSIVLISFSCLGVLHSQFFRFGPSPSLHFMTIPIDTMEEWLLLVLYCCIDTLVKTFGHDSIVPWLTHTISDPKCKTLPYKRSTCLLVMEVYFCYVHVSSMFKFFLSLAQVDFVLINALSDMAMKIFSYSSFMRDKIYKAPAEEESTMMMDSDSLALITSSDSSKQ